MVKRKVYQLLLFIPCWLTLTNAVSEPSSMDSLISLTKSRKEDTALVSLYAKVAAAYQNKTDYDSAKIWNSRIIQLSRKINYPIGEAYAYQQLGTASMNQYKYDEAENNYKKALAIRNQMSDKKGASKVLSLLASLANSQNHYDSAENYSTLSVKYAKQERDTATILSSLNNLAGSHYRRGNYQKAMEFWMEGLNIAEKCGDSMMTAKILGNVGSVYTDLNQIPQALRFQKLALEKRIHNKQVKETVSTYVNLGRCYLHIGQDDSAFYYYMLGLPISISNNFHKETGIFYNNISAIYIHKDKLDSALRYTQLALQEYEAINDTLGIANNLIFEGDVYAFSAVKNRSNALFQKAIDSYQNSLALSIKINSKKWIATCYDQLARTYDEWKKYDSAYHYLEKYSALHDSLLDTTFTQQIAEMQEKYQSEKKQNEINVLNSEKALSTAKLARQRTFNFSFIIIAILTMISSVLIYMNIKKKHKAERQVALLEKQNAIESMRSKIASDVHDEMGANLTRLGLNAQQLLTSAAVGEKEKQLAGKMSLQSKEIITGMREIIWASNPANDNLKSMLGFMRQYIDRFFDGTNIRAVVNFPHDIGEITLHPEVRRNLFLILKESLNNAIKYSGSDKVDVDFNNEDSSFNFSVKDYGKGIDDKTKNEFSTGLNNMRTRAEQIQSVFRMITSPGKGVQIVVEGKLY